jgi:hypothetical protein
VGVPVATMRQQFLSFSPFTSRVGSRTGFKHHVSSHMHVLGRFIILLTFGELFSGRQNRSGATGFAAY